MSTNLVFTLVLYGLGMLFCDDVCLTGKLDNRKIFASCWILFQAQVWSRIGLGGVPPVMANSRLSLSLVVAVCLQFQFPLEVFSVLFRNEVVFKGAVFYPIQLCFNIKTRVAWWVKAKFPSSFFSLYAIVADIRLSDLPGSRELTPVVPAVWKPPHVGWLKFNVDGAARGDGLLGGIGGILKNEFGVSLLSFSSRVGAGPPVLPEVLAIFYCIWLFLKSEFYARYNLVVESDCKVAIDWIREPSNAPSCFKTWIFKIAEVAQLNKFLFLHVDWVINMKADSLAKLGLSNLEVFFL
ncbi:hypothetical protein V6N11_044942 [Hibiscus sabdariffa]|uniref:RNase H type-1 domain-containing protein n=1 Tax=Hibiscus sabdariffa TaxID=183260 RepID=A0ABR2PUE1_9ROSI